MSNEQNLKELEESYKILGTKIEAIKKENDEEEFVIPASVAECGCSSGNFYLRNVYDDNNQYLICEKSRLKISNREVWDSNPSIKMVKANSITDIKVRDLVRFTDDCNWDDREKDKDYGLRLVTKITNERIYIQKWVEIGLCEYDTYTLDYWKHWQVSKRIG